MAGKGTLDNLGKSVGRLIEDNRRLRDEAARLRETRDRLREENKRLAERVAELDKKLTVKELAATFGRDRGRIDGLIRQVDECLKVING